MSVKVSVGPTANRWRETTAKPAAPARGATDARPPRAGARRTESWSGPRTLRRASLARAPRCPGATTPGHPRPRAVASFVRQSIYRLLNEIRESTGSATKAPSWRDIGRVSRFVRRSHSLGFHKKNCPRHQAADTSSRRIPRFSDRHGSCYGVVPFAGPDVIPQIDRLARFASDDPPSAAVVHAPRQRVQMLNLQQTLPDARLHRPIMGFMTKNCEL